MDSHTTTLQRLLDPGKHRADVRSRLLAVAKGLTAYQAARAANRADPGRDYRRCSKGDMAYALCYREDYVVEAVLKALRGAAR